MQPGLVLFAWTGTKDGICYWFPVHTILSQLQILVLFEEHIVIAGRNLISRKGGGKGSHRLERRMGAICWVGEVRRQVCLESIFVLTSPEGRTQRGELKVGSDFAFGSGKALCPAGWSFSLLKARMH
jgi:hypothetical protein